MPAKTALNTPTQRNTVKLNGIQIYYEITGAGPYLVLIEGLGVGTWLWEKQVPDFAEHFTTVAYDNRGSGKSDKPEGPYSTTMMADDLAALMGVLDIPRAHVLGVSLGGLIAQAFAVHHPEKIDRLVLAATTAGGPDYVPPSQEAISLFLSTNGSPRELLRKKLGLAFTESYLQGDEVERLIDLRLANPQPRHAYLAQMAAAANFNLSDCDHEIQAPCLIAAATDDKMVPLANAHNLAKKIRNSQLKIYQGLGHQFFVESSEQFNKDVIEFLTDTS